MSDPYVNREFMIFNCSELNTINFNEVLETSEDTVRKYSGLNNKRRSIHI